MRDDLAGRLRQLRDRTGRSLRDLARPAPAATVKERGRGRPAGHTGSRRLTAQEAALSRSRAACWQAWALGTNGPAQWMPYSSRALRLVV